MTVFGLTKSAQIVGIKILPQTIRIPLVPYILPLASALLRSNAAVGLICVKIPPHLPTIPLLPLRTERPSLHDFTLSVAKLSLAPLALLKLFLTTALMFRVLPVTETTAPSLVTLRLPR